MLSEGSDGYSEVLEIRCIAPTPFIYSYVAFANAESKIQ